MEQGTPAVEEQGASEVEEQGASEVEEQEQKPPSVKPKERERREAEEQRSRSGSPWRSRSRSSQRLRSHVEGTSVSRVHQACVVRNYKMGKLEGVLAQMNDYSQHSGCYTLKETILSFVGTAKEIAWTPTLFFSEEQLVGSAVVESLKDADV